nr:protein FAR1-RELATED SEQUENCE 5 [Ipomoea batatas]
MENEVIEFDIGIGGGGGSEDGDGDVILENMDDAETMPNCSPAHSSDALIVSGIYTPTGDLDLEPFDGMEFESEEAAKAFYNSYARRVGFSTRVSSSRRSRKDGAIIQRSFVCSKEGFRNLNEKRTKDREIKRPRTITRVGCKAALSVKIQDSGNRHEKEVKADYDTMNTLPALKTPSPMEKQASEVYTRKIFMRFQEELVGTLTFMATKVEDEGGVTIYQVAKFGEDHKAYCVRFNVLEMKATCSCQMFEFSGLLCRHVLAVFRVTNVLTLPSHYILKRWTRNAKSTVTLEERVADAFSGYLESHTVRYNMLRHEAFKFVEDGAESVSSYVVAMAALGEASKKVSLAAKHDGKISLLNGRNQDDSISDGIQENLNIEDQHGTFTKLLSEDDVDRKIHELTCELDCASRRCEVYHVNLLSVLKDIEDHKQQLSIKVQNIKISMKDDL